MKMQAKGMRSFVVGCSLALTAGADLEAVFKLLKAREASGQIRVVPYAEAYR